jgi:hypothetical protein
LVADQQTAECDDDVSANATNVGPKEKRVLNRFLEVLNHNVQKNAK